MITVQLLFTHPALDSFALPSAGLAAAEQQAISFYFRATIPLFVPISIIRLISFYWSCLSVKMQPQVLCSPTYLAISGQHKQLPPFCGYRSPYCSVFSVAPDWSPDYTVWTSDAGEIKKVMPMHAGISTTDTRQIFSVVFLPASSASSWAFHQPHSVCSRSKAVSMPCLEHDPPAWSHLRHTESRVHSALRRLSVNASIR